MRRLLLVLTAFFVLTSPAHATWVWPVKGEVITPYRNGTDPYATGQHRGIDIAASVGTPVVAAAVGEVRFAGTAGTSGLTVSIRTGDGYDTSYLHLSSLGVRAGAHVSAGDRIGAVGTTGTRSATAPHLHFGVRDAGTRHAYHDPLAFLPPPGVAREPGPPTPAPAPAPEPVRPAPEPSPLPTGAPVPRGAPAPRRAPIPRGAPAPRGAPVLRRAPVLRGAPSPAPSPRPSPAPRPSPLAPLGSPLGRAAPGSHPSPFVSAHAPSAVHAPVGQRGPAAPIDPSPDQLPSLGATSADTEHPAATRPRGSDTARPASVKEQGADIGWALACGGLLLAAAVLGLTGDKRRTTAARTGRIAAILLPLAGRR
jgi:hypothetical protein